jgi:hypothetical protein
VGRSRFGTVVRSRGDRGIVVAGALVGGDPRIPVEGTVDSTMVLAGLVPVEDQDMRASGTLRREGSSTPPGVGIRNSAAGTEDTQAAWKGRNWLVRRDCTRTEHHIVPPAAAVEQDRIELVVVVVEAAVAVGEEQVVEWPVVVVAAAGEVVGAVAVVVGRELALQVVVHREGAAKWFAGSVVEGVPESMLAPVVEDTDRADR